MSAAAALVLADARFPAGSHAHSGGVEAAVTAGLVAGLSSLDAFLRGRLHTAGLLAAGLTAAACAQAATACASGARVPDASPPPWARLDAEADARTPSPAQREASRRQGRTLLRAARATWPGAPWLNDLGRQPHHPVILGAVAAAAGCSPLDAARIAAYQAVAGPASAAVRLLALDPMQAAAVLARLSGEVDSVATVAASFANGPLEDLPCPSAPALDLLAQDHARAEVRLFES